MNSVGMLLIISGPSGSGKGTVVKRLDPAKNYALSISVTTRPKRAGEEDGREYFFKTVQEFEDMRNTGQLLEHAEFCGNLYGTPLAYVQEQIRKGKTVVLEIEVNGALQVKRRFNDAVLIFLIPPTKEELANRLIYRNTEDRETIEDRLKRAEEEVRLIDQYDYLVVNDTVEQAVSMIDTIVLAESMKPSRSVKAIIDFRLQTEDPKGDGALC